jgi:hypothetical protein
VPGRWGAAANGKFEKPTLYAIHMIWPKDCGLREDSETGREYSDLRPKQVYLTKH